MTRRGSRRGFIALVLVAACGGATAGSVKPDDKGAATAIDRTPASAVGSAIVDRTNSERARAGMPALQANAKLMHAAQIQADQMARAGKMAHSLPGSPYPEPADRLAAAGYRWRTFGENVAWNQRDANAVMALWMNSSGHRANILSADFTEMGAAVSYDAARHAFYVQVFARPS